MQLKTRKHHSLVLIAISAVLLCTALFNAMAAPVAPLNKVGVPDVNLMGLLDQGNGMDARWPRITQNDQRTHLQQLGKALFYDMQVGGDGVQACASCHFHAGADNRKTGQMSPGLKSGDTQHDLAGVGENGTLSVSHYELAFVKGVPQGIAVSEAAKIAVGATPDLPDGTPGMLGGKTFAFLDVNDVVSSQGIRKGEHHGVTLDNSAVDTATLAASDPGFNFTYKRPAADIPNTVRRVAPRNTPSTLNAVFNFRNFWDGRADAFFNGVNPLGFRDPDVAVKVYYGGIVDSERLRIPFSSLASQAVGPIESDMEMVFHHAASGGGRPHRELGKKLAAAYPLAGQLIDCNDSLLGTLTDCSSLGKNRGLSGDYGTMVRAIFDQRFWGDGADGDVCLDGDGDLLGTSANACHDVPGTSYTMMEWNFSMFFGLAIQSYVALLNTGGTIVDIIAGGIATGTVTNVSRNQQSQVDVAGLPLDFCVQRIALSNSPEQEAIARDLCSRHYSKFIHLGAVTGAESASARYGSGGIAITAGAVPVSANTPIGGCLWPTDTTNTSMACSSNEAAAQAAIMNVEHGLARFYSGSTGCSFCHVNSEFTNASVSAVTGFGAVPTLAGRTPPGLLAREAAAPVIMERMTAYNGLPAVYDAGFYNLGVRPTAEDLSLGDHVGGVPLAFSKLVEVLAGGDATGLDSAKIHRVEAELALLKTPTAVDDLTPLDFNLDLACGRGLRGRGDVENNPGSTSPVFERPNIFDKGKDYEGRDGKNRGDKGKDYEGRGDKNRGDKGKHYEGRDGGNRGDKGGADVGKVSDPTCNTSVVPGERLLRNGAFKTPGLRNIKFTGPYYHNGSKMNLRQVLELYKTAGHFPNLNFNNLSAEMRLFNLAAEDESSIVEMMETGLTDWRVAYEEAPFDHPEICVPHGHDIVSGKSVLVGIPAVGASGSTQMLQTFEEQLMGIDDRAHNLKDDCTVPGISFNGLSTIDVPPAPTL